jgi:hypothetical protein
MRRDRWNWFAVGLVLGLLIGAGGVGGYAWMMLNETSEVARKNEMIAQEEALHAKEAALHAAEVMHKEYKKVVDERDRALNELEEVKKAGKDR